ncbi:DUF1801 domain-containing protein [Pseudoroseicyclus sp. H15]
MSTQAEMETALVDILRRALPGFQERVKWNAPSFAQGDVDLITLRLPPKGGAQVIFHRGAKAVDTRTGTRILDEPRLIWATDQRAHVAFASVAEVEASADWLAETARAWATLS